MKLMYFGTPSIVYRLSDADTLLLVKTQLEYVQAELLKIKQEDVSLKILFEEFVVPFSQSVMPLKSLIHHQLTRDKDQFSKFKKFKRNGVLRYGPPHHKLIDHMSIEDQEEIIEKTRYKKSYIQVNYPQLYRQVSKLMYIYISTGFNFMKLMEVNACLFSFRNIRETFTDDVVAYSQGFLPVPEELDYDAIEAKDYASIEGKCAISKDFKEDGLEFSDPSIYGDFYGRETVIRKPY